MIIVGSTAFAQIKPAVNDNLLLTLQFPVRPWQSFLLQQKPAVALPADFYSKQLGFFCRQEIKMDKVIKVPFRFRLGGVEQCDWLEGKNKR